MLVREFHDEVWWPRCEDHLREVTLESYACAWRKWVEPTMGDWELASITPRMPDAWIEDKGIRPNVWRVAKALIRTAYKYEVIDRDPCDRVLNPPPKGRPSSPTLTREEMLELMDGLEGTPVYAIVVCSCTMGLRREEACALRWEDFDWKRGTVRIERGVQFVNGREIEVKPKTILSLRTLPLPPETVRRLYPLRGTGRLAGTYHVHQIANRFRSLCRRRGLPYVPLSNLRNSWCTMMINSGMPVSKVSRYMGHADVETTMKWYTRAREDELGQVAAAWDVKSTKEGKRQRRRRGATHHPRARAARHVRLARASSRQTRPTLSRVPAHKAALNRPRRILSHPHIPRRQRTGIPALARYQNSCTNQPPERRNRLSRPRGSSPPPLPYKPPPPSLRTPAAAPQAHQRPQARVTRN